MSAPLGSLGESREAVVGDYQPGGDVSLLPDAAYTRDETLGCWWGNHHDMSEATRQQLRDGVLARSDTAFARSVNDLAGYCGAEGDFEIVLTCDEPVVERQRHYSAAERAVLDEKCGELLKAGIIEPCRSAQYAACTTMPAKKDADGNWTQRRCCQDYRRLNKKTKPDKYGMPLPEDLFQRVGKARFFSKIDLRSGFHQIPVRLSDRHKTAFWWGHKTYQFTRMPFGLVNATAKFQRVIDRELQDNNLTHCAAAFVDDVLIWSETAEQHVTDVLAVLDAFARVQLKAHPDKSVFGASTIEYLGHNISADGLSPHEAKVAAIRDMPPPRSVHDLQSTLGLVNYYRHFCPNFAQTAQPLYSLLKKGVVFRWGERQQHALDALKAAVTEEGRVLRRLDPNRPIILHTDWSHLGIGAVLGQLDEHGQEYMCACISRSLNKHERNYSSYQGEMLAVVWAVHTLRPYLHGVRFTVVTDHLPLQWLMTSRELTGQHARWALSLQEYDFTIEHRPGVKHQNADILSRCPLPAAFDGTGARLDGAPTDTAGLAASLAQLPATGGSCWPMRLWGSTAFGLGLS